MSDEIVVTRDVLKAIGADTRIAILKALGERQKTQSELATELKLSPPTVLEHLDHLASAGLVERIDDGRKWKYYKLTKTGARIVSKSPIHVVMILSFSLLVALAALFLIAQKTIFLTPVVPQSAASTLEMPLQADGVEKMRQDDSLESPMQVPSEYGAGYEDPYYDPSLDRIGMPVDYQEPALQTTGSSAEDSEAAPTILERADASSTEPHPVPSGPPSIIPEAIILVISFTSALICAWYLMRAENAYHE